MARYQIFSETIWPSIKAALGHLQKQRKERLSPEVHAGINFSIILGSACYLEGVLEGGLKAFLEHKREIYNRVQIEDFETRRSMNFFYSRIEEDIRQRVCFALGAVGYDEMFELLTGERLSKLKQVVPIWEGITVLFQLRNVLGHGREVTAVQRLSVSPIQETFSGGYRHAQDYLQKRKLLGKKFTEAHSEYIFLSDVVADHFWQLVQHVPNAISESLPEPDKRHFDKALVPTN